MLTAANGPLALEATQTPMHGEISAALAHWPVLTTIESRPGLCHFSELRKYRSRLPNTRIEQLSIRMPQLAFCNQTLLTFRWGHLGVSEDLPRTSSELVSGRNAAITTLQLGSLNCGIAQRWLRPNCCQDHCRCTLNEFATFVNQRGIAVIELDVIRGSCSHLESECVPYHECDRPC